MRSRHYSAPAAECRGIKILGMRRRVRLLVLPFVSDKCLTKGEAFVHKNIDIRLRLRSDTSME